MTRHTVGLSVGPPSDSTGVVVVETVDRRHAVRHVQRFPAGTGYSEIVDAVEKVLAALDDPELVVEVTGVGAPIAALFSGTRVVLTAGERDTSSSPRRLPRLDVAAGLQLVLQEGRLGIAPGPLADGLARDLRTFNPRPSSGAASELAWRDRPSDDLVYALAVAVWYADKPPVRAVAVPVRPLARRSF